MAKTQTKKAPATAPAPVPPTADEYGRVHMEPGTVSGDRFAFDNAAVRMFEQKGWSALQIAATAGQLPAVTAIMDMAEVALRDASGRPVPVRDALARYGLVPLYTRAVVALVWSLQDMGLLAGLTGPETDEPDASGEA